MHKLKLFRENAGLTQQELADKLGIDRTSISKVEGFRDDFKGADWVEISRILNVSLDKLLGRE